MDALCRVQPHEAEVFFSCLDAGGQGLSQFGEGACEVSSTEKQLVSWQVEFFGAAIL